MLIQSMIDNCADEKVKQRLEKIQFKSEFRAPEMQGATWMEVAALFKELALMDIARIFAGMDSESIFTEDELVEVRSGLILLLNKHKAFIQTLSDDEQVEWSKRITSTESALEKVSE